MLSNFQTRFWELDFLRGLAIIMMIISNVITSISYFNVVDINTHAGFWKIFATSTATLFILLVGISLTLSYAKIRNRTRKQILLKYLKRGLMIFSWGLAITFISWFFIREDFIIFGILHFIGLAIILAIPFLKHKFLNLIFAMTFIAVGFYTKQLIADNLLFIWMGLTPAKFSTVDYFPIFPWFGIILLGIFMGNLLYKNYSRNFQIQNLSNNRGVKLFSFLGRNSLIIYLIHQPIIITTLYILGYIII